MTKKSTKNIFLLCGVFVFFAAIIAILFFSENIPFKKKIVNVYPGWAGYTFESAVDEASTIVYGKISKKHNTQVYKSTNSAGELDKMYYTESTIDVIDVLKGNPDMLTTTYTEMGGETLTHIYQVDGLVPVNVGEEYIFFLNENGYFLSPMTLIPVSDENVLLQGKISPYSQTRSSITVSEYSNAIRSQLETK